MKIQKINILHLLHPKPLALFAALFAGLTARSDDLAADPQHVLADTDPEN